jgi:hypothetical protein
MSLLNPLNLVLAAVTGIGLGIWKAKTDWLGFRRMLEGIGDWILGTKFRDPKNLGYGVPRAFPKGVVPRAMPVQPGWLPQFLHAADTFLQGWWDSTASPMIQGWVKQMLDLIEKTVWEWLKDQNAKVDKWVDDTIKDQREALLKFFDPLVEGAKSAGKFITDFIIDPLSGFISKWQDFWNSLPDWIKGGTPGGNVIPRQPSATNRGGAVWNPLRPAPLGFLSAKTYGPHSQGASYWDMLQTTGAYDNPLWSRGFMRTAAISPDMLKYWPLRSWADVYDTQGNLIRHVLVADKSYLRKGVPNVRAIELYNDINFGRAKVRRSPIQGPATKEQLEQMGRGHITLNYNAGGIHIHGIADEARLHGRLARHHALAVEQFQRMLAEAMYRRNRSAFDGAHAV